MFKFVLMSSGSCATAESRGNQDRRALSRISRKGSGSGHEEMHGLESYQVPL